MKIASWKPNVVNIEFLPINAAMDCKAIGFEFVRIPIYVPNVVWTLYNIKNILLAIYTYKNELPYYDMPSSSTCVVSYAYCPQDQFV